MYKATALFAVILVASLLGCMDRDATKSTAQPEPDVRSVEFLLGIASELNASLPMKVDAETELLNVSADEATIIYNYRLINYSASQVTAQDLLEKVKPTVRTAACTSPETRDEFLQQGITMRYVYNDNSNAHIGSFDITPGDCGFD